MSNIRKESFYLNQMAVLTKSTEHHSTYTIMPQYGEGSYTIYKVIPGLSLGFNNFTMNQKTINHFEDYLLYSKPILKINYCLKGKMLAYNRQGKACISSKNSTAYYSGRENIYSVEHFDRHYESVTLFGYIHVLQDIFESIFQVNRKLFTRFCELISVESEFIVVNTDVQVITLVNEIKEASKKNDNELLRLKAIELLLYELKNMDKNQHKKQLYYNRSTIEKIKNIEAYMMDHLDEKMTIGQLSNDFNVPVDTLKRAFKQMYSYSIYAYIKKARLERGKELLERSDKGITEIALICGYNNHHSFSKAFKEQYKMTPRESRKLCAI